MRTIELLYTDEQVEDLRQQAEAAGCKDVAEFIGKSTALFTTLGQAERDGGAVQVKQSPNAEWEPLRVLSE